MIITYNHTKPELSSCLGCPEKVGPIFFLSRPLGPTYINIWGIFTIVGVWMINTYHHHKPEPWGYLCWLEKGSPLYLYKGPWGPYDSTYGAYSLLWVCGYSMPFTILNRSLVAVLVVKKKQVIDISKHSSTYGAYYHCECVDNQCLSPYRTKAKWLLWMLRKSRSFIFQNMPLGPTFFNIWGIFTLWMYWWWIIITIQNHSRVAAFDAKKNVPLYF